MNALYILCGLGVASLVAEIIRFRKGLLLFLMAGIAVAGVTLALSWNTNVRFYSDMVVVDNIAISMGMLVCGITFFWIWMSGSYFKEETHITDHAALVLFVAVGAMVLTSFNNMAMLFLGIEILSISLYVLSGSKKDSLLSNEAGFKYFLMGSFATGFLLMGITLIYGATGSFHLDKIAEFVTAHKAALPGFFYAGVILLLVGMLFKVSAVPFHFWAPDVYEGSPTVITALMSTVVKVGAFAALYRLFAVTLSGVSPAWNLIMMVITVLTLVIANVTAVFQISVKRMLAYSSVGHAGYILMAIYTGGESSSGAMFYYLLVYSVATLAAFSIVQRLENKTSNSADCFNGLYKRNPFLAVVMTTSLLSLAGIPPLAGFLGKYMVLQLALRSGHLTLVILAVITSLIGVYYYFKVIVSMYFRESSETSVQVPFLGRLLLGVLLILSIVLGVWPDPFMIL